MTSQRGVSGIPATRKHCTAAGTAPSPTIHRHPVCSSPYSAKAQPTTYATTCPSVMDTTFMVTSLPRNLAGASSAMKSGTTKLAAPTAAPTTDRPITMLATVTERACMSAPSTNSTSVTRMTRLRPSESASAEPNGHTSSANSDVHDVTRDLSMSVSSRSERLAPTETSVAEMTPVSSAEVSWKS